MTLHRALWAGRIMSAIVVIALVAETAPFSFSRRHRSRATLQETGFAMDLTRVVGPIILACAQGGTLPVYYNPTNRKSSMVATNDIGAEVATLLTGPAWSGQRVVELGSMVTADEVAEQLGEVLNLDVKAFAVPRAGWAEAFEQFGIPKGHTGPAEEMFEAVNAGWMDLGVEGTEHVAGTTSARDVFAAAQKAVTA